MPPRDIFIVRHGERKDHMDPSFSQTTARPHDPPLTETGIGMAISLGRYMVEKYNLDPDSTVVLCSPLLRCVQTSDGILRGVRDEAKKDTASPIYLEPGVAEGAYWMFYDMKRNPSVVSPQNEFKCPSPMFESAEHYRDTVSRFVKVEKPYSLNCDPVHVITSAELLEPDFTQRIRAAGKRVLGEPQFDNKTVVLVAHGETTLRLFDSVMDFAEPSSMVNPPYTAFVYLKPHTDGKGVLGWAPQMEPFTTPHLKYSSFKI